MAKERQSRSQETEIYKWAFSELKKAIQPYFPKEFKSINNLDIKLEDGNVVRIESFDSSRAEISVDKGKKFSLNFVVFDSGISNIGSLSPKLAMGDKRVDLENFGVGFPSSLMAIYTEKRQDHTFDLIGLALTQWVTNSIQAQKLLPVPEISIIFSPQI